MKALEIDPESAAAFHSRALDYREMGEHEKALFDFSRAAELDPGNAMHYYELGQSYFELGRYEEASSELSRAMENAPYLDAYCERGHAYRLSGRLEKAVADYDKAIELSPRHADAFLGRGLAYRELGLKEKSAADLELAIVYGSAPDLDQAPTEAPGPALESKYVLTDDDEGDESGDEAIVLGSLDDKPLGRSTPGRDPLTYPALGWGVIAAGVILILCLMATVLRLATWIRSSFWKVGDATGNAVLWSSPRRFLLPGLAGVALLFLLLVFSRFEFYQVFPVPYEYSDHQQAVIEQLGNPDSFYLAFPYNDEDEQDRLETWYYFDYETAYTFLNGEFQAYSDIDYLPDGYLPARSEPALFNRFMSSRYIQRLLSPRNGADPGIRFPLAIEELWPDAIEPLGIQLHYYRQTAAGFDVDTDRLIYIRATPLLLQGDLG
jgi:Flp pilus assembly protein TadD